MVMRVNDDDDYDNDYTANDDCDIVVGLHDCDSEGGDIEW